jgi:hypothetical protein
MIASRILRGNSMPVDGVVYSIVLNLIVFLIFRVPIWQDVDFTSSDSNNTGPMAAGITLFITGFLTLTVHYWAGPSHT